MDKKQMMEALYANISDVMSSCGFTADRKKGEPAVYERGGSEVLDFLGDKGRVRLVFNENRVHMLFGEKDIETADDSAFTLDSSYLFLLDEYGEKDVKSLAAEIGEYMSDIYIEKKKAAVKSKAPATVSKAAARSGQLAYDPVTLASKLAGMYPQIKDEIKLNIDTYGEFLCEDFFVKHGAPCVIETIKENNPQKMRRLFNILGEVYEDGTNEVQSLIAVTVLGPLNNDSQLIQRILPYLTDTMLEPVLSVNKRLAKSKSAQLRLENPPKYKPPKKKKSGGIMSQLMGGGAQ